MIGVRGERAGELWGREGSRARPTDDGVQAKREQELPPQDESLQVGRNCCDTLRFLQACTVHGSVQGVFLMSNVWVS